MNTTELWSLPSCRRHGIRASPWKRFLTGDRVVATDTSEDALGALARNSASPTLLTTKADISIRGGMLALSPEVARQATGQVNVLINVAGFFPIQPFLEMSADRTGARSSTST